MTHPEVRRRLAKARAHREDVKADRFWDEIDASILRSSAAAEALKAGPWPCDDERYKFRADCGYESYKA